MTPVLGRKDHSVEVPWVGGARIKIPETLACEMFMALTDYVVANAGALIQDVLDTAIAGVKDGPVEDQIS